MAEAEIRRLLAVFPVLAIIGPRQCGKSTLARHLLGEPERGLYLDLELPSDLRKLGDAEAFLSLHVDSLVCLDEVQRMPELFPLLRALSDRAGRPGRFLVLGSAGPELLRQGSESLAGRIAWVRLTPFQLAELGYGSLHRHWLRGGFPGSWLSPDDALALRWRREFLAGYLERDVPALGFAVDTRQLGRLWTMLAHANGQLANKARLGESLGISAPTVARYIAILEKTFMVRVLEPFHANVKKRLVKTPKVYLRDTGILHALLDIADADTLWGHPVFGQSWESYAVETLLAALPDWQASFYRTSDGTEIDLVLTRGTRVVAVECKATTAPRVGAGFFHALQDLGITEAWIACPFLQSECYPFRGTVQAASLDRIIAGIAGTG